MSVAQYAAFFEEGRNQIFFSEMGLLRKGNVIGGRAQITLELHQ